MSEPLPKAVEANLPTEVQGLTCPNCAGALGVQLGLRVVECSYCKTPLLALNEIGRRRLAVEPRVDAEKARSVVRSWLDRGWKKEPKLRTEAEVGEALLCFLPFYRVEADGLAVALGTEERTRTVGTGKNRRTERYEVDVERSRERSFDRTWPALEVAEWGVGRINLRGDHLVSFEPEKLARLGMVFPPTGSEKQVFEAAIGQFKLEADLAPGLKRVRFRFLETVRERLSIIYYPLWVVRYRFRERGYQVLVDAEDAKLAYGKAPGNDLYRALLLVGTQAATLFVATTALQLFGAHPGALVVLGAPVLAAWAWAWKTFRYGGVVIEGTGVDR